MRNQVFAAIVLCLAFTGAIFLSAQTCKGQQVGSSGSVGGGIGGGIGGGGSTGTGSSGSSGSGSSGSSSGSSSSNATRQARADQRAARQHKARMNSINSRIASGLKMIAEDRLYSAYCEWQNLKNNDDSREGRALYRPLTTAVTNAARAKLREAEELYNQGQVAEAVRLRREVARLKRLKESERAWEALQEDKDEIAAMRLMEIVEGILATAQLPPPPVDVSPVDEDQDVATDEEEGTDEELHLAPMLSSKPMTPLDQAAALPLKHQRMVITKLHVVANYFKDTQTSREAQLFLTELESDPRLAEAFADSKPDGEADTPDEPAVPEPKELKLARMYRNGKLYDKAMTLYQNVIDAHADTPFAEQAQEELAETDELKQQAEKEAAEQAAEASEAP